VHDCQGFGYVQLMNAFNTPLSETTGTVWVLSLVHREVREWEGSVIRHSDTYDLS
jgi:hypothetical protein